MRLRTWVLVAAILAGVMARDAAQAQERFDGAYGGLSLGRSQATAEAGDLDAEQLSAHLGIFGGLTRVRDTGFAWGAELGLAGFGGEGRVRDGALDGKHRDGTTLLATGRIGFATDQVFAYGILGLGATNGGLRDTGDSTDITVSPVFGLGAEIAIAPQWSGRMEWTRQGINGRSYDFGAGEEDVEQHVDTLSLGVVRRF